MIKLDCIIVEIEKKYGLCVVCVFVDVVCDLWDGVVLWCVVDVLEVGDIVRVLDVFNIDEVVFSVLR